MSLRKKKATKKAFRRLMMKSPKTHQPSTLIFPICNTDYKRPVESETLCENIVHNVDQKIKQADVASTSDSKINDKEASIKVFEMRPSTEGTTLEDYSLTLNEKNIGEVPGKRRRSKQTETVKRVSIKLPTESHTKLIEDRESRDFAGIISTPHHKFLNKRKFNLTKMSSVWNVSDKLQTTTVSLSSEIIKTARRVSIGLPDESGTEERRSKNFSGLLARNPHHKLLSKKKLSLNEMSSVWNISDKLQTANSSRIIKPVKRVSIKLPSDSKSEDRESRDFTGLIASTPHHKLANKRKFSLNEMSPVGNVSDKLQTARDCLNEEGTDDSVETGENIVRLKLMNEADLPNYMKYEAPPLPTLDAHLNSDEYIDLEDGPKWQHWAVSRPVAASISCMPNETKRLFCSKLEIVDLNEIFPTIHPSNLKRTSASAVWSRLSSDFSQ